MEAAGLLRDVRWNRKLSQRELAARTGVPDSTIERIESGLSRPRLDTIVSILTPLDLLLWPLEVKGGLMLPRPDVPGHDARDRAGRQFPAHLYWKRLGYEGDGWWGWRRIAHQPDDPQAPTYWYWHRPRRPGAYGS